MSFMAAKKMLLVGGGVTDADARALIARMSPKPSQSEARRIDKLIKALKSGGAWSFLSSFYMLAAHSRQAAYLNWKEASNDLTEIGTAPFTVDRGLRGDTNNYAQYDFQNHRGFGAWVGYLTYPFSQPVLFGTFVPQGRAYMFGVYRQGSGGPLSGSQQAVGDRSQSSPPPTAQVMENFLHGQIEGSRMVARANADFAVNPTDRSPIDFFGKVGVNAALQDRSAAGYTEAMFRASWAGASMSQGVVTNMQNALADFFRSKGIAA